MAKPPVRLFDLKKWLTLEDAARHLSLLFGEEVTVADVLRLALDGHLTVSINLVNKAKVRKGRLVALEDCMEITATPDAVKAALIKSSKLSMTAFREGIADLVASFKPAPAGIRFTDEEWLVLEEEVATIDGVWDLPLLGAERLDVEHRFQQETDGPDVTLVNLNGAFARRDNVVCQFQEILKGRTVEAGGMTLTTKDSYIPAAGLPENAALVVRTAALREFEQALAAGVDKKTLDPREQKTLLCIIGALAEPPSLISPSHTRLGP